MTVTAPPRPAKRPPWLLVVGVAIAIVVATATVVVVLAVLFIGPAAEANRRVQCANNMKNFASIALERAISRTGPGSKPDAEPVEMKGLGLVPGQELTLLCPEDHEGRSAAAQQGVRFSYLTRDIARRPLPKAGGVKSPLFVCLRHPGYAIVAFDDASVAILDREALGLAGNDPIETGPDSKCELLRPFPARPAR